MEYKFKLLKIHCAGCAVALEQKINEIEGVVAEINFVTKVLRLIITTDNPAETLTEVKTTISNFDHMIEIADFEDTEELEAKIKKEREHEIIRLAVALAILVVNYFLPVLAIKICIFAADYVLVSYKTIYSAILNLRHGKIFDENFLMIIASIGAFAIGEFVEAVMVMWLFLLGSILEEYATNKSKKTISSLLEIKQPYANYYDGESDRKVSVGEISVGDLIIIKPGERVPLDGTVVEGSSCLNMSALTGETKEVIVIQNDSILSGSVNGAGVLTVKVEKTESESTVSKIIELVEKASASKAKSEKFISKFSRVYTPTVIVLAFLIMLIPPIFVGFSKFSTFAYRALCFLVVSCPCALVISVPLTYFAGIGSFARCGIVVKGANYIETLAKVNSVVFDKTGTLTKGEFEITEIIPMKGFTAEELLETAAYAESFSNHRIANAVIEKYKQDTGKTINQAWVNDYVQIFGMGVSAELFSQKVLVGNARLMKENKIPFYEVNNSGTVLHIAVDGKFAGYIVLDDVLKKDAVLAVSSLNEMNIEDITLATGDCENSAKNFSSKLGIKNCMFNLLPEDKLSIITNKIKEGKTVAFVGDGINDAPTLAASSVGISMGKLGTDTAVEASDVIIMTDEPSKVSKAIKKAKKTHRIALENIVLSIGIKVLVLGLIGFGLSGMWLAVFADVGVNLLAVLNSLRAMLK